MFVNARAITEKDTVEGTQIIVQIRNKPHEGAKKIELPGGQVNEYESLFTALKREVYEETGLVVTEIGGLDAKIEDWDMTRVKCDLSAHEANSLSNGVNRYCMAGYS